VGAFFHELIHAGLYKKSQGRITRQLTFFALAATVAIGIWKLHMTLKVSGWIANAVPGIEYWLPILLLFAGLWGSYRVVNVPSFADFLIAVEAEMNKVSWPSRIELFRASLVVLFTIFALAFVLAGFDLFWRYFFSKVVGL
jgi:preprotein translocase subunit SecE